MGMSLTSLSVSLEKTSQPGLRVSQTTLQLQHNPPHCPVVFLRLWTHRVSCLFVSRVRDPKKDPASHRLPPPHLPPFLS